jgi:acetyl esterase
MRMGGLYRYRTRALTRGLASPAVPLTTQARRLLDRFEELGVKPYDQMSVLEARDVVAASRALQGPPPDVDSISDHLAPGAAGALPVRLYHPAHGEQLPLLVYFHGGGWVTGSVDVADTPCRALANATRCAVASVEYRRSPETKFPGPAEDCYAATCWLSDHARELGADPGRLVVCGDSAGGNLATVVAMMSRDRGGPDIAQQVLLYPTLAPTQRRDLPSHHDNAEGYGLRRSEMEWFWDHYLATPEAGLDPYAAPLLAEDLSRLPPAFIVTAEFDVLRDEGTAYAERLRAAGVSAETLVVPGLIHGFFWMAKALDEGGGLPAVIAAQLGRH